jgi:hypothetical protein
MLRFAPISSSYNPEEREHEMTPMSPEYIPFFVKLR